MSRNHSLLFTSEMIDSILVGRKTQTRRLRFSMDFSRPMLPGDTIYIKEGHYRYGHWKKNGLTKTGRPKWRFVPDPGFPNFVFLDDKPAKIQLFTHRVTGWYKRSPLFMPKAFARHWLHINAVRYEHLHNITEVDAQAEGAPLGVFRDGPNTERGEFHLEHNQHGSYLDGFKYLWMNINGRQSWEANPLVRVITFKRIVE